MPGKIHRINKIRFLGIHDISSSFTFRFPLALGKMFICYVEVALLLVMIA